MANGRAGVPVDRCKGVSISQAAKSRPFAHFSAPCAGCFGCFCSARTVAVQASKHDRQNGERENEKTEDACRFFKHDLLREIASSHGVLASAPLISRSAFAVSSSRHVQASAPDYKSAASKTATTQPKKPAHAATVGGSVGIRGEWQRRRLTGALSQILPETIARRLDQPVTHPCEIMRSLRFEAPGRKCNHFCNAHCGLTTELGFPQPCSIG